MADQQRPIDPEDIRIAPLPPPPPFFQHFTTKNINELKDIEEENDLNTLTDDGSRSKLSREQILALPVELRCLIPPEPPTDDEEFKVFGQVTTARGTNAFGKTMQWITDSLGKDYTLENWEYEQLYPPVDTSSSAAASTTRQQYLFRLLRSILVAYIELLGIIAANPVSEHKSQKLRGLLNMVTNMHSLINEYRPHQAREILIAEMQRQVERKKREIEGVRKMGEKVRETLDGFGKAVKEERGKREDVVVVKSVEERREEVMGDMWMVLDEVLG